ncbi:hypothetical protein D3C81_1989650 [compost metagenome]
MQQLVPRHAFRNRIAAFLRGPDQARSVRYDQFSGLHHRFVFRVLDGRHHHDRVRRYHMMRRLVRNRIR